MIERYFLKGTLWTWAAPPADPNPGHQDGTIVQSGNAAPPAFAYAGLDSEIKYIPSEMFSGFNIPMGFNIPYVWLDYVYGRTAYVRPGPADVLTGFMSGCWICSWTQAGARRVGHVGTVEFAGRNEAPNSTVKNGFTGNMGVIAGGNLTGYNPAEEWSFDASMKVVNQSKTSGNLAAKVMSLVTSNNDFYSILMIKKVNQPNAWICGGKKRAVASNQAAVVNALA